MREMGEGIKRIFELMQAQDFAKPELYSNGSWFKVSFFAK
jgi:predicted HTH transcriptional regulator